MKRQGFSVYLIVPKEGEKEAISCYNDEVLKFKESEK
jgi:hypothetical protein